MTVSIRDLRTGDPGDAEAVVRLRRSALPFMISTSAGVAHEVASAHPDKRHRVLLAERADGRAVATAQVGIAHESPEPGRGYVNLQVHPDHRGLGFASALLRAAEEHLTNAGAVEAYAWVLDGPADHAFAARHGYRPGRSAHFLRLELSADTLPPYPAGLPPGVEVRPASAFADDPRPLYEADAEVTSDEPGDLPVALDDYDNWLTEVWREPSLDHDLTTVVLVDGVVAAFAAARTDGAGRYGSAMTGTRRAHRGRGLAKLAKTASLRRALAAGCTEALTGNDAGNAAMLAVNKWFGYEIRATETRFAKRLVPRSDPKEVTA